MGIMARDANEIDQHIRNQDSVDVLLSFYGSFRHWGHPYVDEKEGLRKLNHQCTVEKDIDVEYAASLASDLAKMVLKDQFQKKEEMGTRKRSTIKELTYLQLRNEQYMAFSERMQSDGGYVAPSPLDKVFSHPRLYRPYNLVLGQVSFNEEIGSYRASKKIS